MNIERPAICAVFVVIGVLGLIGSLFVFINALGTSDGTSAILEAYAFSGIFGSVVCFAISYTLARLNEIVHYQKVIAGRTSVDPINGSTVTEQPTESISPPLLLAAPPVEQPASMAKFLLVILGILALVVTAVVISSSHTP